MIKEILKEKETIAYLSLRNDLINNHLAHSYLFYGDASPLKKDAAFLLAQSIIEDKNDFACEVCNNCLRIKNNEYYDVYYLDGHISSIKKDQIEELMKELNKTPLEKANKKIYIIDNINNSSPKVLNMILKFMEEPNNDNIYGIFISDNIDNLLPTIVSRCQKIPFKTRDFSYLINEYLNDGLSFVDAYLLSNIKHEHLLIDNDSFSIAKEFVYKTIDNFDNLKYIEILFSREFISNIKKDDLKETTDYYLDIFIKILNDSINDNKIDDEEYNNYLNELKRFDQTKLLNIILSAKDKTNSPINRSLLFDQIASKIIL